MNLDLYNSWLRSIRRTPQFLFLTTSASHRFIAPSSGHAIMALDPVPLPEDGDLYHALGLSRDASAADLKAAFRRLSQRFHPDKHVSPALKAVATDHFTRFKEAYEILSVDKLRRVYDEFGIQAARAAAMPGMELVPFSDLKERFRSEPGTGPAGSPRDAYFTVSNSLESRMDATGLADALRDGDITDAAIFTRVNLSTMATAYVSQENTIAMRYALSGHTQHAASRDSGIGEVAVSLRRQLDPYMHVEGTAFVPLDMGRATTYGFKAFRTLSNDMSGSLETTFDPTRRDLTSALTYARSFDKRCSASVSWAYGAIPGYAFTWRRNAYDEYVSEKPSKEEVDTDVFDFEKTNSEKDSPSLDRLAWCSDCLANFFAPMGWRWTIRWNALDPSLGFVLRRPVGKTAPLWKKCEPTGLGGASLKLRGQLGAMGWEVEVGGGCRYVMVDTAWSTSVAFGTLGVVWKLKMNRSGHRFSLPVVLHSSHADPVTATVAALSTSLFISALQILIISPWRLKKEKAERDEAKARRADVLKQNREEAEAALKLIQQSVGRSRRQEEGVEVDGKKGYGLLIVRALYGVADAVRNMKFSDDSLNSKEVEMEVVEVRDCVQVLVESSSVQIVSMTKSTLMGFWDPSAYGDKEDMVLRIWYMFKKQKHECILRDNEPIELPLSSHRVEEWS